jgi:hypothetical protein
MRETKCGKRKKEESEKDKRERKREERKNEKVTVALLQALPLHFLSPALAIPCFFLVLNLNLNINV